ncbi:MAG: IMPACT family member YigZ [Bacteroidetes bacterium ADurb.Bin234]|jgi:uncharacterized YigZ family protein|nr:MAG: IMPACT family member YigZ [Bacteroidetes bacterium ADurb.Bin234]
MQDDIYKTIEKVSEAQYKEKGSRFIALLFPVRSEDNVKSIIHDLKKEHYNATHHCYAYTIGHIGEPSYRINDDGEPSGTAGKPIYGQLLSFNLKNVLAVVIRYYGGTKLGVSGLINAYKTATRMAIEDACIVEKTINNLFQVRFDFELMNEVMQVLKKEYVSIKRNDYEENKCLIEFEVLRSKSEEIVNLFAKLHSVRLSFIKTI